MADWAVSSLIPEEDFDKLAEIGKRDQRSIAFLVRKAVHEYIIKEGAK
jgi:hypothetical protein